MPLLATTICHPTITYNPFILGIITFTLRILEKNSDITKDDRDNNEGVLHYRSTIAEINYKHKHYENYEIMKKKTK